MAWGFRSKLRKVLSHVTVEPIMFLDGACSWSMQVFMEVVQMKKICSVGLGYEDEVCSNLSNHTEENILVQKQYSLFAFQNSIMMSVLPLIFVLFMGSWSDKYGRKIPFIMTTVCHSLWSGGYLLNNWQSSWPIELIYVATFFDSIGGCMQGFLSTAVAYISDVTDSKARTSRVSIAVSLWYFGGPLGNLIGALAIQYGGITLSLGIVFMIHISILLYIIFYIKESHGPFAVIEPLEEAQKSEVTIKKEDITKSRMVRDFFNWRRVAEAFKTAFKSREGYSRAIFLTIVVSNMIRRIARGFFMYPFVQTALNWDEALYTYWSSYRTLIAATGSLVMVPILTRLFAIADPLLIVVGSLSLVGEYCCYGLVSGIPRGFFMWIGPLASIISNASIIAHKSMATKLVSPCEKGRVSAVMSATQGLMPMVGYAMYAPIYHLTVETFPEAQFFFGASLASVTMITFMVIHISDITNAMEGKDSEKNPKDSEEGQPNAKVELKVSPVSEKKNKEKKEELKERKEALPHSRANSEKNDQCGVEKSPVINGGRCIPSDLPFYENAITDREIMESESTDTRGQPDELHEMGYLSRKGDQRNKR